MTDREERIRRRAYELWENSGRPEGKDNYFWNIAAGEIDAEGEETPPLESPNPA
jgi:hypothetical protein